MLRTIEEIKRYIRRLFLDVIGEKIDLIESWRDDINRLIQFTIVVTHYGEIQTANLFLRDLEPQLLDMPEYAGRTTLPSGEVALTFKYYSRHPVGDE